MIAVVKLSMNTFRYLLILLLGYCQISIAQRGNNIDLAKSVEKRLQLIPSSTFFYGCKLSKKCAPNRLSAFDIRNILSTQNDSVELKEFYISETEVSNFDYLWFLYYVKRTQDEKYSSLLPDTLVWEKKIQYCSPYTSYYFRHPAYRHYPVVGLTYEQANSFCLWLTNMYNSSPSRSHNKVIFRLPTVTEWVYAASGKNTITPFPWKGNKLISKGQKKANFLLIEQTSIQGTSEKNEQFTSVSIHYNSKELIQTAPVKSFQKNAFGLYNMAGNVAEYTDQKGICMGGSWATTGFHLHNYIYTNPTEKVSSSIGFRFVMEVLEAK